MTQKKNEFHVLRCYFHAINYVHLYFTAIDLPIDTAPDTSTESDDDNSSSMTPLIFGLAGVGGLALVVGLVGVYLKKKSSAAAAAAAAAVAQSGAGSVFSMSSMSSIASMPSVRPRLSMGPMPGTGAGSVQSIGSMQSVGSMQNV